MYCVITDSHGKISIESSLYWQKDSYKIRVIDLFLRDAKKKMIIKYFNELNQIVEVLYLGYKNSNK